MKKCVLIYNPNSGKGLKRKTLKKMEEILRKHNFEATILQSEYSGHIEKIVHELPRVDVVFSIGGDGTFNEAISGNAKRDHPLLIGHIPCGTTNDFGYMLGCNKNVLKSLELLLNGCVRWMDTCYVNNKLFTYAAGIGKFMKVSYNTSRRLKKRFGYAAYLIEGVKDLISEKLHPYKITYKINGKYYTNNCSFLLISNSNRVAGMKHFHHDIKLNDQLFEILICTIDNKKELIKRIMMLPTVKDIKNIPGIYTYKAEKMEIMFQDSFKKTWTIDGEPFSQKTPFYN